MLLNSSQRKEKMFQKFLSPDKIKNKAHSKITENKTLFRYNVDASQASRNERLSETQAVGREMSAPMLQHPTPFSVPSQNETKNLQGGMA
jgi:hypothetical protein